jgi:hypothetical protein
MNERIATVPNYLVLGAIVCGFLCVDFTVPAAGDRHQYLGMILLGICAGQVSLIATWAALAAGNGVVRLPWALLLAALMWYSVVLGSRAYDNVAMSGEVALHLGIVLLAGVIVAQIPLWIARSVFRWRLVIGNTEPAQPLGRLQFGLRHLLLGTALLAAALSPARAVLSGGEITGLSFELEEAAILAAVALCNLLITVPCLWDAFSGTGHRPRVAFLWLVYCALLTVLESGALFAVLGASDPDYDEVALMFFLMNVSQCATVFGVLRFLRALGFRLVRAPAAVPPVDERETAAEGKQVG